MEHRLHTVTLKERHDQMTEHTVHCELRLARTKPKENVLTDSLTLKSFSFFRVWPQALCVSCRLSLRVLLMMETPRFRNVKPIGLFSL